MWPINTQEFETWCHQKTSGNVVQDDLFGEEIACVFEGQPGKQHEREIFITERGGIVIRDEDYISKFRSVDEHDYSIMMTRDKFEINNRSRDETHRWDL